MLQKNIGSDFYTEMPINHFIEFCGNQKLTIQIFPNLGQTTLLPNSMCKVEIWCYELNDLDLIPIKQICSSFISISEAKEMIPYKTDCQIFYADVIHHIIRWSDCEAIQDNENLASEVITFYNIIGEILAKKQYHKYIEYIKDRETNVCMALSLDENEKNERSQILFNHLDNGFVLHPLTGNENIHFYANRKLVVLMNNEMNSALRFINKDTDEILFIDLLIGKKKGKKHFSII